MGHLKQNFQIFLLSGYNSSTDIMKTAMICLVVLAVMAIANGQQKVRITRDEMAPGGGVRITRDEMAPGGGVRITRDEKAPGGGVRITREDTAPEEDQKFRFRFSRTIETVEEAHDYLRAYMGAEQREVPCHHPGCGGSGNVGKRKI